MPQCTICNDLTYDIILNEVSRNDMVRDVWARGIRVYDAEKSGIEPVDMEEALSKGGTCIIFDCDGVLIDVRKSYDDAIGETVKFVLKKFAGITNVRMNYRVIEGFKNAGGFNDERHLAYAVVISHVAAKNLKREPFKFVLDVISNADESGVASVEKYIKSLTDISKIKRSLKFDAKSNTSILHSIFDQIFYGPKLYNNIFKQTSSFKCPGKIERDDVLVRDEDLRFLWSHTRGKIALVTGRGRTAAEYSLGSFFRYFDANASMFLEDMDRSMAKPNPNPLLQSMKKMGVASALYVGDSVEDLIMVKKAQELGSDVSFCGIVETAHNQATKAKMLVQDGAEMVVDSVQTLVDLLYD